MVGHSGPCLWAHYRKKLRVWEGLSGLPSDGVIGEGMTTAGLPQSPRFLLLPWMQLWATWPSHRPLLGIPSLAWFAFSPHGNQRHVASLPGKKPVGASAAPASERLGGLILRTYQCHRWGLKTSTHCPPTWRLKTEMQAHAGWGPLGPLPSCVDGSHDLPGPSQARPSVFHALMS